MIYQSPTGAKPFYLSTKLKQNLDIGLNGVKNYKQDMIVVIDGDEGSGKSQTVRQLALYCADTLGTEFDRDGVKNIHSSMEKYVKCAEDKAREKVVGWVNILDESRAVLGKAGAFTRPVRTFINWLSECRDMRQVHFILLPKFHDLHKYVVLNRMTILVHMYKDYVPNSEALGGYDYKLGAFKLYANDEYLQAAYSVPYRYPKVWAAHDRFSNVEVLTEKGLEALSEQKANEREKRFLQEVKKETIDRDSARTNILLCTLHTLHGYERKKLAKMVNLSFEAVKMRLKAGKENPMYRSIMGFADKGEGE